MQVDDADIDSDSIKHLWFSEVNSVIIPAVRLRRSVNGLHGSSYFYFIETWERNRTIDLYVVQLITQYSTKKGQPT
jgi:hypothetical protein